MNIRLMSTDQHFPFVAYHHDYTLKLPERHRVPITKYNLLPDQLLYRGVIEEKDMFEPGLVDPELLAQAHESDYLYRALTLQLSKREARRIGYPYNEYLIRRERRIVQGTLATAEIALKTKLTFNLAGGTHHAGSNWGEGFCLFNDVATASLYMLAQHHLQKILIIDLDVHQGNGTAEILQDEPRVFTFSMHGKNNFPFRKEKSDLDIGLEDHAQGKEYLALLEEQLDFLFSTQQPELVFYLAGADVLDKDRLGRLDLTKEDCKERDYLVFNFCKTHEVPVQVGTAGGYSNRVGETVDVHSQTVETGIDTIWY